MLDTRRPNQIAKFNLTDRHLRTVLDCIHHGEIVLPHFHRNWCWRDGDILALIASVAYGNPIGGVTLLEARPMDWRPINGAQVSDPDRPPLHLVLDGQQRLTAMYQACYLPGPVRIELGDRPEYRRYFIDMEKAVAISASLEDAIFSITTTVEGVPTAKVDLPYSEAEFLYERGVFPANFLFDARTFRRRYSEFWDTEHRRSSRDDAIWKLNDFDDVFVGAFAAYRMPVQSVNRHASNEEILRIFEKLNRRGPRPVD